MASVSTTIPQAIEKLTRMQGGLRAAQTVALQRSAEQSALILADEVRARTPVGTAPEGEGQHLRDTTEHTVSMQGASSALITVRQTKTIEIKGDQVPLAVVLRKGADPPSEPITPVNKKALKWQGDSGPIFRTRSRGRLHKQPPNLYAQEARDAAMPVIMKSAHLTTAQELRKAISEALR